MEDRNETGRRENKRKRKKSFLQNARGFGKKGKFGHGSQLDQDTYDYFIRVFELLQGEFDSPEDKASLVENALVQTEEHEVEQSSNQVGCRVLEALVKVAPNISLTRFMKVFLENLRIVITNRFASHVLQALIQVVTQKGLVAFEAKKEETAAISSEFKETDEFEDQCLSWFLKIAKFALNNLDEFVWDEYANHVIRTIFGSLVGDIHGNLSSKTGSLEGNHSTIAPKPLKGFNKKEMEDTKNSYCVVPKEFSKLLQEFFERISAWPNFSELAYSNISSALLQVLIKALAASNPKLSKKLTKLLIDRVFSIQTEDREDSKDKKGESKDIPQVFTSSASIHLLETALEHAQPKYVTQIYAMCFMNHIVKLGSDPSTNFSVQKLLANCSEKSEFDTIFEELAPGLSQILTSGCTGVLLSLAQACRRLSSQQGSFIQHLMKVLNCWDQEDRRVLLTPLAAHLWTYEQFQSAKESGSEEQNVVKTAKDGVGKSKIHLHGSLIIQTMLHFNKPIKVVNSLLEMPASNLRSLFCDTKGCHIMDTFVSSEFVGEKSRERMVFKLQGSYVAMACSKHGSRALEALYAAVSLKHQIKIMEELAGKEALVTGTPSGAIIANKYSLNMFKLRRNEWKQLQTKKQKTKDMFASIIGDLN